MKRNSGSLSIYIGASILVLTFFGLIGAGYTYYINKTAEEETDSSEMSAENDPLENLKREKNLVTAPVTEQESSGMGTLDTETGIPTGTYSNPPTSINSGSTSDTITNRPIDSYSSGINDNPLEQESLTNTIPDYSRPSSSNNFNSTSDNSLLEPLDNDDFLDVPDTNPTPAVETPSPLESSF